MLPYDGIGRKNGLASRIQARMVPSAYVGKVVDRCSQTGKSFVVLRSCLPAIRQLLGTGAHLVRTEPLQLVALSIQNAKVRSEKFVAGTGKKVAIKRTHIDGPVRCIVYGVDKRARPGRACHSHNLG